MARANRPRRIQKYDDEFKRKAVALSNREGAVIKDVADGIDIHPNVLSKWRKEARDGLLGDVESEVVDEQKASDLAELTRLRRKLADTETELEILKKLVRFSSQRTHASNSSKQSGTDLASRSSADTSRDLSLSRKRGSTHGGKGK